MKNLSSLIKLLLFTLLFINSTFLVSGSDDSSSFKRNLWFYSQRYAPDDTISEAFMQNAVSERLFIESSGYMLNPLSNSWISLGGIIGRINFVKFTNDNRVIIGGPNAGPWIYDNSTGWQSLDPNNKLTSNVSGAIAIDNFTNPPTIYYGTGEGRYGYTYSYLGNGIFKTTNWGNNWTNISNGLESDLKIFRITIRPGEENNEQIFAATNKGLYRSTNSGDNWNVVAGTSGLNCNDIQFSQQTNTKAYLTGPSPSHQTLKGVGFRISTDGGETFTIYAGGDFLPYGRTQLAVCESNDNYIYAISDYGNIYSYTSTDGGSSFYYSHVNTETNAQGGHNMFIKVALNEPNVAFIGGVALRKTTNYGRTFFSGTGTEPIYYDFHDMDFNPNNSDEVVVVNDGGIFKSTNNGNNWVYFNNTDQIPFMNAYRISNGLKLFAGVTDRGFAARTAISGFADSFWGTHDGTSILSLKFNPNIVIGNCGADDGRIRRSTNNGNSLDNVVLLPGVWDGGNDWIGVLTEHPTSPGYIYTARRNTGRTEIDIYRSTDYGASWITNPVFGSVSGTRSPQNFTFSSKNPDIVYLSTSGYDGPNWYTQYFKRALYKSTNGGASWLLTPLVSEDDTETIPNLYITRVVTIPSSNSNYPDEVYLTFSGFYTGTNLGHILKSTNEGNNWININGNLPNSPVNDLVWWNSECGTGQKTLAAATDVGVFSTTNGGTSWQLLAQNLPMAPVLDLEYVRYNNSLLASTFGRGVWQVELEGDIFIKEVTSIPTNTAISKNIIICNGGILNINNALLSINDNKKIIIKNGGKLVGGTDAAFYSSNSWNGIVVEPGGELILNGCYFDQTSIPITIEGDAFIPSPSISVTNCNFLNNTAIGTITINNRDNVTINSCKWSYPGSLSVFNKAIDCYNSNDILIDDNDFNISTETNADISAIFIDYGNDIVISNNNIKNLAKGITVSNSSPFIYRNNIEYTVDPANNVTGAITLSNSYSANLKQNNIINYQTGINLQNSSPLLFENDFINNLEEATALVCETNSSPRLRPQESGGQTIWDAGKNNFEALYTNQNLNLGNGVFLNDYSIPDFNFGCNIFNTSSFNITGDIADCLGLYYYLFARNNSWNVNYEEDVCDADWETFPDGCNEGSGGSEKENDPPPQPIVINYGNRIYDTIQITNRNVQVNTDQALYLSANNDEITGNYLSAVTKYGQIIQDYQDSLTALNSLRKLLHCRDKMNADTSSYSQLRTYYQGKIQSNLTDTAFVNVAEELAAKCLVRMGKPTNAIDEYEVIISNTNDSSKILCAELNIIETYLIIQNSGDSPNYTGQLGYLKPATKEDAYKKIMDRLHKNKKNNANNTIPKVFKLSQNYPNPFNPITKINYSLPGAVKVNIQVYDILGRLVKTLVNEFKEAGNYVVQFDGTGLASGVYLYRIEAGDFTDSKKMVLVK